MHNFYSIICQCRQIAIGVAPWHCRFCASHHRPQLLLYPPCFCCRLQHHIYMPNFGSVLLLSLLHCRLIKFFLHPTYCQLCFLHFSCFFTFCFSCHYSFFPLPGRLFLLLLLAPPRTLPLVPLIFCIVF